MCLPAIMSGRHLFNRFTAVADVFPDRVFPLELIDVTKKANLNQLYQMRLRLTPDPAIPLAAGMSVNVTIDYEAGGDNLTVVPLSAIFQDKENRRYGCIGRRIKK